MTQFLSYFASQHNAIDEAIVADSPFPQGSERLALNTMLSGMYQQENTSAPDHNLVWEQMAHSMAK